MFVISLTKNRLKKSVFIGSIVVALSIGFVLLLQFLGNAQQMQTGIEISRSAGSENDILAFISNYNWQVDDEPVEVRDVIIPEIFDDVYSNYNKIQIEQGFDLEKYAGQHGGGKEV